MCMFIYVYVSEMEPFSCVYVLEQTSFGNEPISGIPEINNRGVVVERQSPISDSGSQLLLQIDLAVFLSCLYKSHY
jgi:hypothetical protein